MCSSAPWLTPLGVYLGEHSAFESQLRPQQGLDGADQAILVRLETSKVKTTLIWHASMPPT